MAVPALPEPLPEPLSKPRPKTPPAKVHDGPAEHPFLEKALGRKGYADLEQHVMHMMREESPNRERMEEEAEA